MLPEFKQGKYDVLWNDNNFYTYSKRMISHFLQYAKSGEEELYRSAFDVFTQLASSRNLTLPSEERRKLVPDISQKIKSMEISDLIEGITENKSQVTRNVVERIQEKYFTGKK